MNADKDSFSHQKQLDQEMVWSLRSTIHKLAVIVFGVIFPVIILFQAYKGIDSLRDSVLMSGTTSGLLSTFSEAQGKLAHQNDYALFSLLFVEHANLKGLVNKQVMKVSIVHIGFAVISVGLMLIILGINEGDRSGAQANVKIEGLQFDFKTGSTGVAMFAVGAIMATVGGVLKNEYTTSAIPRYSPMTSAKTVAAYEESIQAYKACAAMEGELETCFAQFFYEINSDRLE